MVTGVFFVYGNYLICYFFLTQSNTSLNNKSSLQSIGIGYKKYSKSLLSPSFSYRKDSPFFLSETSKIEDVLQPNHSHFTFFQKWLQISI